MKTNFPWPLLQYMAHYSTELLRDIQLKDEGEFLGSTLSDPPAPFDTFTNEYIY